MLLQKFEKILKIHCENCEKFLKLCKISVKFNSTIFKWNNFTKIKKKLKKTNKLWQFYCKNSKKYWKFMAKIWNNF